MKQVLIPAFLIMAYAQWFVPGNMIWGRQRVLDKGKVYKFQTQPIDPVNPFKGRYVSLNFSSNSFRTGKKHGLNYGQKVYIQPGIDSSGFAVIKSLLKKPPAGTDYIEASVDYINDWNADSVAVIYIKYPFEEFYMEEFKAPKAEKLYWDTATDHSKTFAVIKAFKGDCVIEDLYINNKPIGELIK